MKRPIRDGIDLSPSVPVFFSLLLGLDRRWDVKKLIPVALNGSAEEDDRPFSTSLPSDLLEKMQTHTSLSKS